MSSPLASSCANNAINSTVVAISSISEESSDKSARSEDVALMAGTKLLNSMGEREFEARLKEFCSFARLGFTILNQSPSQLAEVRNALRSLGEESVAGDLLRLVAGGNETAEFFQELTRTAKLRCEAAFEKAASHASALNA